MTGGPHELVLRGRAAVTAGDYAAARAAADERLKQAPGDLDALEVRAVAERSAGDRNAAAATLHRMLSLDARHAWAHAELAMLLYQSGDAMGAEAAARAGLLACPDSADLHNLMGAMRSEADDLPGGEHHVRQALALVGAHPVVSRNLAINLTRQGRLTEADKIFAQIHRSQPRDGEMLAHWARMKEAKGDLDEALALLDQAEAAGRNVSLQRATTLSRKGEHEAALALIDAHASPNGDALLERGRILDRLGRYDEAWAAFVAGKAKLAQRLRVTYDARAVRRRFDELARFFSADQMRRLPRARARADAPQPIFVLGFPRSGTTMIEQMLSSHSAVRAGGELPFMAELAAFLERTLRAPYPSALGGLGNADLLRDFYLQRAEQYGLFADCSFFTDKMPLNEEWLPLIRIAFPASRALRLRRHPLDVCVSMMAHHMTHGGNCGYRLEDIAAHIVAVEELVAQYEAHGAAEACAIAYEGFVAMQERETRRALDYLGLKFDPACLAFHANPRHAPTPSYAQVTAPLNDRSVGRWRNYAKQLAPVMPMLKPLAERLGYSF